MEKIISVSQYLDKLNNTLKGERAKIIGEVSELKMYEGKSYLFFSLRDKIDQSVINCIMWKNDYRISGVELRDGLEVIITAYPEVYKPNGRMTFKVELVELVGEGALQIAYEKLKKKLENEGFFAESRKRPLPDFPHRIGVISSKNGAVINDFLTNIGKFGYEILFVDSRVEGQDAIKDLLSAIETLRNKNIDVLVIMRGGGSLESFLAFNNEMLVRSVAKFPVPVLTGIGHEKDIPLVSLVSDKNVSTPTAVANLLNSTWDNALSSVRFSEEKIMYHFTSLLDKFRRAEETLFRAVERINSAIRRISDEITLHTKELTREFTLAVTNIRDLLTQSAKTLELSSPERQLSKGYSIVRLRGKVLRSVKNTKKNDILDISLSDGIIESQII
ncbi:MAG: exodeoxyribonuclease VII large subunit [Candidatus Zambryskibacteria bacterium]|nr:exodeoxyribonuclease VII large subunit [Candidatus Zambryskibacteria bacterium]